MGAFKIERDFIGRRGREVVGLSGRQYESRGRGAPNQSNEASTGQEAGSRDVTHGREAVAGAVFLLPEPPAGPLDTSIPWEKGSHNGVIKSEAGGLGFMAARLTSCCCGMRHREGRRQQTRRAIRCNDREESERDTSRSASRTDGGLLRRDELRQGKRSSVTNSCSSARQESGTDGHALAAGSARGGTGAPLARGRGAGHGGQAQLPPGNGRAIVEQHRDFLMITQANQWRMARATDSPRRVTQRHDRRRGESVSSAESRR